MKNLVRKITKIEEAKDQLDRYFSNHILDVKKMIDSFFVLTKNIGNVSKIFSQYAKNRYIKEKKTIEAVINEVDNRMEEVNVYLKMIKNELRESQNVWKKHNLPNLYENKGITFARYAFYSNCHLQYSKFLNQNNDYQKILSHYFECLDYITYMINTSYFNPKYVNTEFLSLKMSVFIKANISMEEIKTFNQMLVNFDSVHIKQLIEFISSFRKLMFDIGDSLGIYMFPESNVLRKKNIVTPSGYKEYVLEHIEHLLFQQYVSAAEKEAISIAKNKDKELCKKLILEKIMSEHKSHIEKEII